MYEMTTTTAGNSTEPQAASGYYDSSGSYWNGSAWAPYPYIYPPDIYPPTPVVTVGSVWFDYGDKEPKTCIGKAHVFECDHVKACKCGSIRRDTRKAVKSKAKKTRA